MDIPDGWTADTVHANGIDLQYYRTGTGPPLVLAHGAYNSGLRWLPLADDLADDWDLVAYDARGHGHSDAPGTGYTIDDRIEDLSGLITALDLDDPVLMGHSMGAGTVAWAAARDSDGPRAVVLVDPMGIHDRPDDDSAERVADALKHAKRFAEQTVDDLVADDKHAQMDATNARRLATARLNCEPHALAALAREGYPKPLATTFPNIRCPTLLLRADVEIHERVRDLNAADALQTGRLVHIPDAGHQVFQDEFDAAFRELLTFLRRLD